MSESQGLKTASASTGQYEAVSTFSSSQMENGDAMFVPNIRRHSFVNPGGQKIGVWMLVGLIFFSVSGGPVGMEVSVRAGGPFLALMGFLIVPLVWSVPEAAMTAELSIAYPEAAGFAAWSNAAFGPFVSFQCSMMSYFSGVLDNAVYPVLLIQYVSENESLSDISDDARVVFILGFTALLTFLCWRGLDVNGMTCVALTCFILLPFIVFTIVGIPQVDPSNWFLGPVRRNKHGHLVDDDEMIAEHDGSMKSVKWHSLINVLFWNLNYFHSASAFSGDCIEPAKTFPKAMFYSLFFIVVTYFVTLLVATGAAPNANYCDGCFVGIATEISGPWLGYWITIAATASCIGQFLAEMASDSFQIMGMADAGQLPKFLSKRSKHGTPTIAILFSAAGVAVASSLDFTSIVELVNILYIFAELIEFASFIKLRQTEPAKPRAWKIPIESNFGLALFFLPPTCFLIVVLSLSTMLSAIVVSCALVVNVLLYFFVCTARINKLCKFEVIRDDWGVQRDPIWVQNVVRYFTFTSAIILSAGENNDMSPVESMAADNPFHEAEEVER